MDKTKQAIESLSMDLLRTALAYHKGSNATAKRFANEALKRKKEINLSAVKPYFAKWLNRLSGVLANPNTQKTAEDALMHSVISRNYAKKFCK